MEDMDENKRNIRTIVILVVIISAVGTLGFITGYTANVDKQVDEEVHERLIRMQGYNGDY